MAINLQLLLNRRKLLLQSVHGARNSIREQGATHTKCQSTELCEKSNWSTTLTQGERAKLGVPYTQYDHVSLVVNVVRVPMLSRAYDLAYASIYHMTWYPCCLVHICGLMQSCHRAQPRHSKWRRCRQQTKTVWSGNPRNKPNVQPPPVCAITVKQDSAPGPRPDSEFLNHFLIIYAYPTG